MNRHRLARCVENQWHMKETMMLNRKQNEWTYTRTHAIAFAHGLIEYSAMKWQHNNDRGDDCGDYYSAHDTYMCTTRKFIQLVFIGCAFHTICMHFMNSTEHTCTPSHCNLSFILRFFSSLSHRFLLVRTVRQINNLMDIDQFMQWKAHCKHHIIVSPRLANLIFRSSIST